MKILAFLVMLCLLCSIVSADLGIENGKLVGEKVYQPNIIDILFSGQAFSFVGNSGDVNLANSVCSRASVSPEFTHLSGVVKSSGATCNVGQYIAFVSTGGDIPTGTYLFDKLWYKSSTTDLVTWSNYYLNNKNFNYYYVCYNCNSMTTSDTETGCLSKDKLSCVSKSDLSCGTWYGYESVCLTHVSSVTTGGTGGNPSPSVPSIPSTPSVPPTNILTCYYCDSTNQVVSVLSYSTCSGQLSTTIPKCQTPSPTVTPTPVTPTTPDTSDNGAMPYWIGVGAGLLVVLVLLYFLLVPKRKRK
jgi:hypothetical protein